MDLNYYINSVWTTMQPGLKDTERGLAKNSADYVILAEIYDTHKIIIQLYPFARLLSESTDVAVFHNFLLL